MAEEQAKPNTTEGSKSAENIKPSSTSKFVKDDSGTYRVGETLIARQDVAFKTVKSASIAALVGAGLTYGAGLLLNRKASGSIQFNQGKTVFSIAALLAGAMALIFGYESNRNNTFLNDKFDFLEKYKDYADPDGIIESTLKHTGNKIKRSNTEEVLSNINFLLLAGSLISKPENGSGNIFQKMAFFNGKTNENIFDFGWKVGLVAEIGAYVANMENSIKNQRREFSHAERLIQDREAASGFDKQK